ncbi:MAG: ABC transporter substrate-binding protein, partial [Clostridia bacterium]
MKNGKKLLGLLLCVLLLTPLFSACALGEAPDHSKEVNLVWYQFVDKVMPDHEKVMEEVNKYLKEKINATVTANFMTLDDYQQKMPVIVSSGQEFDVCFSTSWMLNYNEYVAKKAFLPIDDLLTQYAPETKAFIP